MNQALILIDIQNDYFREGAMQLSKMEESAAKAQLLLHNFRENKLPVFHIQHIALKEDATFFLPDTQGAEIHESVTPDSGEVVITKSSPNSFRDTSLLKMLKKKKVKSLVICGAMSHMCVDSTTRAAYDLGFNCTVIEDACATLVLTHKDILIEAAKVHGAFMAALSYPYADVVTAEQYLSGQS